MKELKLMEKLQEEFFKAVEAKTSWGKNELQKKYLEVKAKVLSDALQQTN